MADKTDVSAEAAKKKITELMKCGDDRIELAAAKELVAITGKESKDDKDISLEVTIKIV